MSVNFGGPSQSGMFVLFAIWSIAITIFWMVVAWRAMRAHERMAAAVDDLSRRSTL
jgi:uncharacterized membrane protein